jgi:hypothetical protein
MQLRCVQTRPASQAAARQKHAAGRLTRCSRVLTRYQKDASHVSLDDVSSAPRTREVSAGDTYAAAVANMPEGAWAGRWERWAPPPAEGFKGGIMKPDETGSGWQLLTSGLFVVRWLAGDKCSIKYYLILWDRMKVNVCCMLYLHYVGHRSNRYLCRPSWLPYWHNGEWYSRCAWRLWCALALPRCAFALRACTAVQRSLLKLPGRTLAQVHSVHMEVVCLELSSLLPHAALQPGCLKHA